MTDNTKELLVLAAAAKHALLIAGATNHADLMTPAGTFALVHDVANELTIATQSAVAGALGWLEPNGDVTKEAPAIGALLWAGNATAEQIDAAVSGDHIAHTLVGWQIADHMGENIQGDDQDPSGYTSFEILTIEQAVEVVLANPGNNLLLQPIYDGDIEDATMPEPQLRSK